MLEGKSSLLWKPKSYPPSPSCRPGSIKDIKYNMNTHTSSFSGTYFIILISNRSYFPSPDCALVWPYVWHTNLLYMVYQKYQYNWIEIGAIKKPFKAHAKTDIPLLWDEIIWMSGQEESSSKKWCESKLEVRRRAVARDAQRLLFISKRLNACTKRYKTYSKHFVTFPIWVHS